MAATILLASLPLAVEASSHGSASTVTRAVPNDVPCDGTPFPEFRVSITVQADPESEFIAWEEYADDGVTYSDPQGDVEGSIFNGGTMIRWSHLGKGAGTLQVDFLVEVKAGFPIALNGSWRDSVMHSSTPQQPISPESPTTVSCTAAGDDDDDGHDNHADNCPTVSNPSQADLDQDGFGDACDNDDDGDGVADGDEAGQGTSPNNADSDQDGHGDGSDNCPATSNGNQADLDNDGQGDACDTDDDNDGWSDGADNCPTIFNPGQENSDSDNQGDACDNDPDNDGLSDGEEAALGTDPLDPDTDDDTHEDGADNCPTTPNANQQDTDNDGQGDACDDDDDGDGWSDGRELAEGTDPLDPDTDDDGRGDASDNCPQTSNSDQANADNDGQGDACDTDDDNDGVPDGAEPAQGTSPTNADSDGDGAGDGSDNCPTDANADQADNDGDGLGDACDDDDDNDGHLDGADNCPTDANADQADDDNNGIGDVCDGAAVTRVGPAGGPCSGQVQMSLDVRIGNEGRKVTVREFPAGGTQYSSPDQGGIRLRDGSLFWSVSSTKTISYTITLSGQQANPMALDGTWQESGSSAATIEGVTAYACGVDTDGDDVADGIDNCPNTPNANQLDSDEDGAGDACDTDDDNDGVPDGDDAFPTDPTETADSDQDGWGDNQDNCPNTPDDDQSDLDGDGQGDVCDSDRDGDGVDNNAEPGQNTDPDDPDSDGDGHDDGHDNCPSISNSSQTDTDGDGDGDACDGNTDSDNDGHPNAADNCPFQSNANQADLDGDGQGDVCDNDDDGDGVSDLDENGQGTDPRDSDSDNDGHDDGSDNCPAAGNADQADLDNDGQGDACDTDDDGDGRPDASDNCPRTPNAGQANADNDGQGDACDTDDDNDGVPDGAEAAQGTSPTNPDSDGDGAGDGSDNCPATSNGDQANHDGDGKGDACDDDDDNDGCLDHADDLPRDSRDCTDTDGDGIGDSVDNDDDGDGTPDGDDAFPLNPAEQGDNDGDGVGDKADSDDDNDGRPDGSDNCPLVPNPTQADEDNNGIGDACDGARPLSFTLRLTTDATSGTGDDVVIGAAAGATGGFDGDFDQDEPPAPPFDGARFYAVGALPHDALQRDIKTPDFSQSYPLRVRHDGDAGNVAIGWSAAEVAAIPDTYDVLLRFGSQTADMRTTTTQVFGVGNGVTLLSMTVLITSAVTFDLDLSAGWNLVSLPVAPDNAGASAVFPGNQGVFGWDGDAYTSPGSVGTGQGYWVLMPSATTVSIDGVGIAFVAGTLDAGWHLLGAPLAPAAVPTAGVGPFWSWGAGGYQTATTATPGDGYWARADDDATPLWLA